MRLLTITNLYPGDDMPRHGIFVEERLRQLLRREGISASVIALRPGHVGRRGRGGHIRNRHGIDVHYLPVPTAPLVTNWIDPILWAGRIEHAVRSLGEVGSDLILDAHFLYPDGAAVALAGRKLGLPVVLTARGSDVNVKCANPVMRRWIRWAVNRSARTITVSRALAGSLEAAGISAEKLTVLRNGVDLEKFRPVASGQVAEDRDSGLDVLSVGHLVEDKGHHLIVEALPAIPQARLTIVGQGPWEGRLRSLAERLGVSQRVRFNGYVPHDRMAEVYSAADVTVLASAREGMPNVILESLACGTRVIATDVGGVAEVLIAPEAGMVIDPGSSEAVVQGLRKLAALPVDRAATRRFAETNLGWDTIVEQQCRLYEEVAAASRAGRPRYGRTGLL